MNKVSDPDIRPAQSSGPRRQRPAQPQVLDLRPGHIRAVAALKEQEKRRSLRAKSPAQSAKGTTARSSIAVKVTKTAQTPRPATTNLAAKTSKPATASRTTRARNSTAGATAQQSAGPTPTANKSATAQARSTSTKVAKPAKTVRPTAKASTAPRQQQRQSRSVNLANQVRHKVDQATATITKHGKRFIISRLDHIRMARRSVVTWLGLMLLLILGGFLQTIYYGQQNTVTAAVPGGTYIEGTTDKLTTVSPLYATTDTEKAASQLIYSGLLAYDDANKLNGELAESWNVDESGRTWTVKLRDGLTWSDGQSLTADDVVYTVNLMKDPDISTTLADSWDGIDVAAVDDRTITFTTESPLMSFDTALTFGVLPKHILDGKSAMDIASLFSQSPQQIVGAGPFQFNNVETTTDGNNIWHFAPSTNYYGGTPKLDELAIRTYPDSSSLIQGLERGEVNAASNLKVEDATKFNQDKFKIVQLKTASGVYVLFNNTGTITSNRTVRDALRLGLDRNAIRNNITSNSNLAAPTDLETPIATGVYESIDQLKQPDYNPEQAKLDLDTAGWRLSDGSQYRSKDGQELAIRIVTIAGTNYETVARMVAEQWQAMGVNATVEAVDAAQAQQGYLMPRDYDVLVYQMHLGSDPDMFAYWSSTQTDPTGLNLANYQSRRADIALANARTNTNPAARETRYIAFVNQWLQDNPAIALYQPSLFYVMDRNVHTLASGDAVIDASNRFQDVVNWTADVKTVMATP